MLTVLVVGESGPGSLLSSLVPGLSHRAQVTVLNPSARGPKDRRPGRLARLNDRLVSSRRAGDVFVEAVHQLRPDIVFVIKGRGLHREHIQEASGVSKVVIFYPDNPLWHWSDPPDPLLRLANADLVITWSERLRAILATTVARVAVVPFGYDHRWFHSSLPNTDRTGIAFLGTWSPRRERYLRALDGLPLIVHGTGWPKGQAPIAGSPLYESDAGDVIRSAAIGVNLLHPQCSGAHNMRTREISACGAMQLTEPGIDGTPLRAGISCDWFRTPSELRQLAEFYLQRPDLRAIVAARGHKDIESHTYERFAGDILELFFQVV